MLWPTCCGACGRPGPSPCDRCARALRPAPAGPPVAAVDTCRSLFAYSGPARRLVTGLKYRNDRAALAWLADGLAGLVDPPPGTVVTWAPTSARRRRRRGFDQAELLAAAVARRLGLPCRRLLVRRGGAATQTGRSETERRAGPRLGAAGPLHVPVLLVDDVVTTGATLRAAALALRAAGAPWVAAVTAARTPRLTSASADGSWRSVQAHPQNVHESLKLATEPTEYRW